jgi:hypothetical protein
VSDDESSWEDMQRLYQLSTIPMVLVFAAFLAYFVFLMHVNLLQTRFDFVFRLILPFSFLFALSGIVTFEFLHHRRFKRPWLFHLKRATGRFSIILFGISLFLLFDLGMEPFLLPLVGDNDMIVSALLSLAVFTVVVLKFKRFISRLDRGDF